MSELLEKLTDQEIIDYVEENRGISSNSEKEEEIPVPKMQIQVTFFLYPIMYS